jgi:hypothetical protein
MWERRETAAHLPPCVGALVFLGQHERYAEEEQGDSGDSFEEFTEIDHGRGLSRHSNPMDASARGPLLR